jgi:glycosyltransferase involved in cell wall biosynthesis
MKPPLRLGFVINFEPSDPPGRWLGVYLSEDRYGTELLAALAPPDSLWARHGWLPPYIREFVHLARRHPRLDTFDILFAWELRNTVATILLRRLTNQRRARVVSLNPTVKGWALLALPLLRLLLRDADRVISFSSVEHGTLCRQLRLPAERFQFVPRFAEPSEAARNGGVDDCREQFVLALGHSNRDFPTLWEALSDTDVRVVMYRNPWMRGRELSNVRAIPSLLPPADEAALVAQAAFHVIPLKAAAFSSGLTVLLRAMAHGKAVIVSDTTGVRDYVRDGETALLVPPGNADALRDAMLRLWNDPQERGRLGRNAAQAVHDRFAAPTFALQLARIAEDLVGAARPFREMQCESW